MNNVLFQSGSYLVSLQATLDNRPGAELALVRNEKERLVEIGGEGVRQKINLVNLEVGVEMLELQNA